MSSVPCKGCASYNKRCWQCQQVNRARRENRKHRLLKRVEGLVKHSETTRVLGTKTKLRAGFVYLIQHPSYPEWVKIGSALNMQQRLLSYQTGDPNREYEIVESKIVNDRRTAETELRKALSSFEIKGEWVKAPVKVARREIRSLR